MVKECDLVNLVEKYLNEKRLDCIDALYLWSRVVSPDRIARTLRIRYGSGGAYTIVISDLNAMKITSQSDKTEDTKEEVYKIIRDIVRRKCFPILEARLREDIKNISANARRVLLTLIRGGWLTSKDLHINIKHLWTGYRVLFEVEPSELEKENLINELIKIGLIEYVDDGYEYADVREFVQRMTDIDKIVKLPKIEISE
jgi:hypothetical protein